MTHYILAGQMPVAHFEEKDFTALEKSLNDGEGDLIIYNEQGNNFGLFLTRLNGWSDFVHLTKEDFEEIKSKTNLEFSELEEVSAAIYWSTADFVERAKTNLKFLKEHEPKEYAHIDKWEQIYDKSKFAEQLEQMINSHDANHGITWETIDEYLYNCQIK